MYTQTGREQKGKENLCIDEALTMKIEHVQTIGKARREETDRLDFKRERENKGRKEDQISLNVLFVFIYSNKTYRISQCVVVSQFFCC